jgi:hypothetical protein
MASKNAAQLEPAPVLWLLILVDVHAAIKSIPARVVKPIYRLREGSPRIFQGSPATGWM